MPRKDTVGRVSAKAAFEPHSHFPHERSNRRDFSSYVPARTDGIYPPRRHRRGGVLELLSNGCDLLHPVLVSRKVALKGFVLPDQSFDVRQGGCFVVFLPQHRLLAYRGGGEWRESACKPVRRYQGSRAKLV